MFCRLKSFINLVLVSNYFAKTKTLEWGFFCLKLYIKENPVSNFCASYNASFWLSAIISNFSISCPWFIWIEFLCWIFRFLFSLIIIFKVILLLLLFGSPDRCSRQNVVWLILLQNLLLHQCIKYSWGCYDERLRCLL